MKLENLRDLFADHLRDLYSAESQLIKALPKMAKAATNPDLKAGFEEHLKQTEEHAKRLKKVCEQLNISPKGKKCAAMEGLIEEGKELLDEDADDAVLDAGLIAAAQKVEHYEIAAYGTAKTWAGQIGLQDAVSLLEETLAEEKETDAKLTEIAQAMVNTEASQGQGEEMASTPSGANTAGDGSKAKKASRSGAR